MENIEKQLNKAFELINNENFIEAKAELEKIIQEDDENFEAYKNLGLCEVNLDNPIDAIKAFKKALLINPDDAVCYFYLASCFNIAGDKEFAIDNFKKVLKLRPNYLDAYKSLAMIYIEFTQFDNAVELLNEAIENDEIEADYSIYYMLSTAYMLKKDSINSIKNLEIAYSMNKENIQLANSLVVCYTNLNNLEKAKEILDEIYKIDENNTVTCYNFATYYQAIGDFKNALEFLQKCYEMEPSVTMLSSLANCAFRAGEIDLALTLYQNLVSAYPNNDECRLSYIEVLEIKEDFKEALKNIEILLSVDSKNIEYVKKKGAYLRKLGKYEKSLEIFSTLLKRGKIDVEVYYNLAFNYVELNDLDNAKEMFKKCIILEPNNPYAHKDLGVLYMKMNFYDWAVDEIKTAIELEEDVTEFHYSLGVCYMMLSNFEEAKKSFDNALKYDENDADTLAYYGYVYLIEKDYDKSYKMLKKALKANPNCFLAKVHIAKYYFAKEQYDIAKEFLLDIVNTAKDDETMNMLGVCYLKTNEFENASGIFSKLMPNYSNNHILLTNLARCEKETGRIDEAKEHLRQALMIFDDYKEALELLEEIKVNGKR